MKYLYLILAALLMLCLAPMPYGYYQLVRFIALVLFAVFEPNDESLWSRVQATCKAFLETLRTSGALKGTADEAYYVTVDDTNNTDATIAEGQLNIEIGYAPVKPAEFVIIKLAHSIEAQ